MIESIIKEVEALANERTKKRYLSQGAKEPVFGLTIKALKPIAKRLLKEDARQEIAFQLYDTGNYDLMYLAGMIVDPHLMTQVQFNDWVHKAYFYMISDFIVAVCLSETAMAFEVADQWIQSPEDLVASAGYATYSWMIANRKDDAFDKDRLLDMLKHIKDNIHKQGPRTRYSMYYLVYNIGVSYLPLHAEALEVAKVIKEVTLETGGKVQTYSAEKDIQKAIDKDQIGFKRKYVRC